MRKRPQAASFVKDNGEMVRKRPQAASFVKDNGEMVRKRPQAASFVKDNIILYSVLISKLPRFRSSPRPAIFSHILSHPP